MREYAGTSVDSSVLRAGIDYTYANGTNYITKKVYSFSGSTWNSSFTYGNAVNGQMPDQVYSLSHSNGLKASYAYDNLGRRTTETIKNGNTNLFTNSYTFKPGTDSSHTTTQVATFTTKTGVSTYTYDENGNIKKISFVPAGSTAAKVTQYKYDPLNRLIREDNPYSNKSYAYTYDINGNITSKKQYAYTTGDLPASPNTTTSFTYNDAVWKDLLTKFGSQTMISYDDIGNPTSINGSILKWTGRMLDSYTDTVNLCKYTYDISGQRYKKDINDEVTDYYYADGVLIGQKTGSTTLTFRYDENGSPMGLHYKNGSTSAHYVYVKNLQGDIVAITNLSGTVVATYTYDAWGKILTSTDTDVNDIGELNPLRYRGYYFDEETGYYYLNSRYYNPRWGRFINADSVVTTDQGLMSFNMYAYCLDNPVMLSDSYGSKAEIDWLGLASGALIACVGMVAVAAVATASVCALPVVLAATAVVGSVCMICGASDINAAFTGYNPVLEEVFQGNTELYGLVEIVASAGAMMGTSYLATQTCFVEGTLVLTESGSIPIETVTVGCLVWAWDEDTNDTMLKEVVATFVNETDELVHVFVKDEEIVCTNEHPFFLPQKGWTAACELRAGDILVTVNGQFVVVEKVQHEILEQPVKVYNFEVEGFHTYFVGSLTVLVHNECETGPYNELKPKYKGTGMQIHHLIEKRFAGVLHVNPNTMVSTPLTKEAHQVFTNAFRRYLPYGSTYAKEQIIDAAAKVYSSHPGLWDAVLKSIR